MFNSFNFRIDNPRPYLEILIMGDLTNNFSQKEFACRCGCGFDQVNLDLVKRLQILRDKLKKSIIITSGCRCKKHNAEVQGSKNSYHLRGEAADIHVKNFNPVELGRLAAETKLFNGIIVYSWGIHLDIRKNQKYWIGV